jgi:mono/diheme cytochrome c family protein
LGFLDTESNSSANTCSNPNIMPSAIAATRLSSDAGLIPWADAHGYQLPPHSGRILLAIVMLNLAVAAPVCVIAADAGATTAKFIEKTCLECHDGETPEGGLNLRQLPWKLDSAETRQRWVLIYDRIAKHEMPPDADNAPDAQRDTLLANLADSLHEADLAEVRAQGRGPMRRLNRGEYEQNVRHLLALPTLDVRDILPEDRAANHSNKSAATLDITRVQLNAYLDAADVALRQAVASGIQPRDRRKYRALATKMFPKAVSHAGRESAFYAKNSKMIPLTMRDLNKLRESNAHDEEVEFALFRSAAWPYYGYPNDFIAAESGEYQVRFFARAVRQGRDFRLLSAPDPQPMTFRARQPSEADVSGDVRATGGIIDVQSDGEVYETSVQLKSGETLEYSLLGLPVPFPITSHGGPLYYDFPPMPADGHPGIAFRWIEITGPIDSQNWPPESHRVLFGDLPIRETDEQSQLRIEVVSENPQQDASRLFRRFAEDAARREVPNSSLQVYEQLIYEKLDDGFAEAMLAGYKAFLCSGHFLFLREPEAESDHEAIASRLSHLLWNSRPDQNLRRRAEASQLRNPELLRAETDRLIDDARFERFVKNFTDYWLDLKELDRDAPDIRLYPEYRGDDYLIESMGWETRAFVMATIRENLPVTTLVDSDFVMVNDRLARHYELPRVSGSTPRKVTLPAGSFRGGLLTQAAMLKVTANGTTTSPILRGAWVMDRIFGDPPPPPPASVPAVEPDIRGAATIREILKAHAADPSCAGCHSRFDPVGLALENFDILGGWRERYRSLGRGDEITGIDRAGHKYSYRVAAAVDSNGTLHDGTVFKTIDDLKQILARDSRQLARNLLQRLVTYATGTPVRFSDRREIELILDECEPAGYRVRDLLHGVIQNRLFVGETALEPPSNAITGPAQ